MRLAEWFAVFLIGLAVGFVATRRHLDAEARAWLAERDSVVRLLAVLDAEVWRLESEGVRLREQATQRDTVRLPARRALNKTPDSLHAPPDLYKHLAIIDTLLREQGVLHDRIARDSTRLVAYATLVSYQDSSITLLQRSNALLRTHVETAPVGRPECRVLGVIPCPVMTAGASAVLVGGAVRIGPSVAIGIPIL